MRVHNKMIDDKIFATNMNFKFTKKKIHIYYNLYKLIKTGMYMIEKKFYIYVHKRRSTFNKNKWRNEIKSCPQGDQAIVMNGFIMYILIQIVKLYI
jgi:hypothetical protein